MEFILLDTDILIDVGRNDAKTIDRLSKISSEIILAVSSITQMELIVGCRNKSELNKLNRFLERFEIFPLTESIAWKAVELLEKYRLSHTLSIPDSLIAATALEYELEFLSKNQKDYRFINSLQLLSYI